MHASSLILACLSLADAYAVTVTKTATRVKFIGMNFGNASSSENDSIKPVGPMSTKVSISPISKIPNFKPNKMFDICYINMDGEAKRNEHLKALLSVSRCKGQRFSAVNGKELIKDEKKFEKYLSSIKLDAKVDLTKYANLGNHQLGMAGCKLSHYLNYKRIEKTNSTKPVLILEDDVDLECDFVVKIEKALSNMPDGWEVLLITGHFRPENPQPCAPGSPVVKVGYFFELLGYIVNGSTVAKKLTNLIDCRCAPFMPIDLYFAHESTHKHLAVYAMKQKQAIQLRSRFPTAIPSSDSQIYSSPLVNSLGDFVISQHGLKN